MADFIEGLLFPCSLLVSSRLSQHSVTTVGTLKANHDLSCFHIWPEVTRRQQGAAI